MSAACKSLFLLKSWVDKLAIDEEEAEAVESEVDGKDGEVV